MSSAVYVVRGVVDPLLGYLSSAIRDEAQLLGRVRLDAQFIKDEMESMNGFLHHLAEVGKDLEHDHQVRAWMKQVRDLGFDTQDCFDLYARRVGAAPLARGFCGHVRRVPFFLRTIPARHRVAKRMRELKARALDVGERHRRYGVKVPAMATDELGGGSGGDADDNEENKAFRRGLVEAEPDILKDGTEELICWLKEEAERKGRETHAKESGSTSTATTDDASGRPVVLAVVAPDREEGGELVKKVYEHSSAASLFDCKVWVTIKRPPFLKEILHKMVWGLLRLQQDGLEEQDDKQDAMDEQQQEEIKLRECVKGKRFLVVVEDVDHPYPWDGIKNILDSSGCSPGSAIIVTTKDGELAKKCSPKETRIHSLVQSCSEIAHKLITAEYDQDEDDKKKDVIRRILKKCDPDLFCMKLFLRVLYVDPKTSRKQLEDLLSSLDSEGRPDSAKMRNLREMMKFCYNMMPTTTARSCLLYLSIFPPNFKIRRASLLRRWVAEGHVGKGDRQRALDRAERCFDELVARGFVAVVQAGIAGNVIRFKVQDSVRGFITEKVRYENFGDAGLPPKLARHLSISSGIQWQQDPHWKKQNGRGNICSCFTQAERHGARDGIDIIPFLESLPAFSQVGRVKVMDLDYCKDLKNHHLKSICNNLFMLKYLSLQNTEVSRLPREIKKLQHLETLDIWQTKVRASATKGLELPKLKHLLAGPINYRVDASIKPDEPLSTVRMPRKIGRMTNMEILCHVEVLEHDAELEHVKNLKRLRNLGVVVHGKQDNVDRLLRVIIELSECLRSLSVWIRPPPGAGNGGGLHMNIDDPSLLSSKSLQRLSINGITSGLPNWIERLPGLAEITLRGTLLSYTSLPTLGKLEGLRCLTLRHNSYSEQNLTFKDSEFKKLESLALVGASAIKRITFETGAAPKLSKIVWTFNGTMEISSDTISGINHLPSLKELELNGDCNPHHVEQAVAAHPNHPVLRCSFTEFQGPDAGARCVLITD